MVLLARYTQTSFGGIQWARPTIYADISMVEMKKDEDLKNGKSVGVDVMTSEKIKHREDCIGEQL